MAIYLYNLLFSLTGTDYTLGRFTQYNSTIANPSITNQSCAFFNYKTATPPPGFGDWFSQINTALTPSDWIDSQPDTNSLELNPGDFVLMRVASLDASAGNYKVRVTGVFGRGTSVVETGGTDLQSPLQMSTSTTPNSNPRAVIDIDGSSSSNWPAPITSDTSWVSWLGATHTPSSNAANDYTLNVGISVLSGSALYTFGRDPRLHVGPGMVKRKHDDCAA